MELSRAQAVLATLILYKLALVAIGLWARRRTHDQGDFFLGGRRLGATVAAISASASSSSAWTLLGVSGAAYAWGLSAVWLFPATVSGFALNWLWVAPRLKRLSREQGSVTLTEVLAHDAGGTARLSIERAASLIVLFSFLFYIASQFQAAGDAFQSSFGLGATSSIVIGGGIIILYTLLGGFWAVSVTDTLQGLLMALTAVVLPAAAVGAAGGVAGIRQGLAAAGDPALLSWTGVHAGWLALAFVCGTLGIGLGYPGQPHVVNRFMAIKDDAALSRGRVIALAWAAIVYAGMITLGWAGRALITTLGNEEQILFSAANQLFPPVVAGVMIAAVLSAIMSTADSQLLVAGSSVAYDWRRSSPGSGSSLALSRVVVLVLSLVAILIALFAPQAIFSRVLFAWHAVGSAFGPLLLVRLAGRRVRPPVVLASMLVGFVITVVFHLQPNSPGDFAERLLPFALALALAWLGSKRP